MTPLFLIADDSEYKRAFLTSVLKESKFPARCIIAGSTEEAIRMIGEAKDIAGAFVDYDIPSEN